MSPISALEITDIDFFVIYIIEQLFMSLDVQYSIFHCQQILWETLKTMTLQGIMIHYVKNANAILTFRQSR